MILIKFQTPTDIPAHQDRDFNVYSAEIVILAKNMLDLCATYLKGYRRDHQRYLIKISKRVPRYTEAQKVAKLQTLLKKVIRNGRDVTHNELDALWWCASPLIIEKRFISAHCPECDMAFTTEECEVRNWAFDPIGDPTEFNGHGGRRVLCPAGHTLYATATWIT
jgi:hypothetical protein